MHITGKENRLRRRSRRSASGGSGESGELDEAASSLLLGISPELILGVVIRLIALSIAEGQGLSSAAK